MVNILLYVLEIVLLITFFTVIILFIFWSIGNFKNKVPFVTSPSSVSKDIAKALEVNDQSIVYDLGSGDGRILFYLAKTNPRAKYVGVENSIFPILLSKINLLFNKKKIGNSVEIINKDFFKQDLSNATHIFTYLYPNVMDELLPKFEKELKPGAKLVSLSFSFASKRPINEIDLGRGKYKLGRKLFVYQF